MVNLTGAKIDLFSGLASPPFWSYQGERSRTFIERVRLFLFNM
ncbi:hypothetical protein VCR31J2_1300135 [Vibrio coralliirubri]|uniref:Uncharacterized protein n=1 Tax=Vibrio coralliirubri TaxID=1516159 RepID=A0AA86X154_9VIBR|nr:hypothetical protein VCR31J2_1300135 [Vibrio coralliirubri]